MAEYYISVGVDGSISRLPVSQTYRGRWLISPHAIEQYKKRFARTLSDDEAREQLIEQSLTAHYVKVWKPGTELWKGPKPRRIRYFIDVTGTPTLVTCYAGKDADYR